MQLLVMVSEKEMRKNWNYFFDQTAAEGNYISCLSEAKINLKMGIDISTKLT